MEERVRARTGVKPAKRPPGPKVAAAAAAADPTGPTLEWRPPSGRTYLGML